jgi:hypothetical protein
LACHPKKISRLLDFVKDDLGLKSPGLYTVCQEESAILWENIPFINLHRYNQTYLYPKLNSYGDNDEISFEE